MAVREHAYTEDKVKTLSVLEHIRLRTGMYIGPDRNRAHYDDGIYILLKEVIDNAATSVIGLRQEDRHHIAGRPGHGRDYAAASPAAGRGLRIPRFNTGAKYNDDVFSQRGPQRG